MPVAIRPVREEQGLVRVGSRRDRRGRAGRVEGEERFRAVGVDNRARLGIDAFALVAGDGDAGAALEVAVGEDERRAGAGSPLRAVVEVGVVPGRPVVLELVAEDNAVHKFGRAAARPHKDASGPV